MNPPEPHSPITVAVGGTAWRNRPVSYLQSLAAEATEVSDLIAAGSSDLADWVKVLWPAVNLLEASAEPFAQDVVTHRLWLGATGRGQDVQTKSGNSDADVPALTPDLAAVHVPYADADGNAFLAGPSGGWFERLICAASTHVVVIADEVVTPAQSKRKDRARLLPAEAIDELVHIPYGAYPAACDGLYDQDAEGQGVLQLFVSAGVLAGDVTSDPLERIASMTTPMRLAKLSLPHGLGW